MSKHEDSSAGLARAEKVAHPEAVAGSASSPDPDYPRYRAEPGKRIDLSEFDPDQSERYTRKSDVKEELEKQHTRIEDLQERLYAEHGQSLLIILQALDAGGKDGTIKHVFEGVNPQGCRVWSFKQPTAEELDHDFLWRYHQETPPRGMMTIFNRSYYEDVLVVRVKKLAPESVWRPRYEIINEFERMLTISGTTILKFFLDISKDEQQERFQARLDTPAKRWKFNPDDLQDRALWKEYMAAFQEAVDVCSTSYAPWYVIPANKKWYRNLVVARIIADTLEAMHPRFPAEVAGLDTVTVPD